ncbi:MAG: hypothetical protein WBP64_19675 [Nitrososphaeraceae archaeon]
MHRGSISKAREEEIFTWTTTYNKGYELGHKKGQARANEQAIITLEKHLGEEVNNYYRILLDYYLGDILF